MAQMKRGLFTSKGLKKTLFTDTIASSDGIGKWYY